jgi:hypothetical protein
MTLGRFRVFLGLLLAGLGLGAVTAAVWLMMGGTLLVAAALYSLVATAFILGVSFLMFHISSRKPSETCDPTETLRPAEEVGASATNAPLRRPPQVA